MKRHFISAPGILAILFIILFTSGCVKYAADYDATVLEEIIFVSKKVDMFFGSVLETPDNKRDYENFKSSYIAIEADLKSLLIRNEIREFNEETVKQIQIALELWQGDKAKHKEKDTIKNFIAKKHREQFARVFTAMAKAEVAKDIK